MENFLNALLIYGYSINEDLLKLQKSYFYDIYLYMDKIDMDKLKYKILEPKEYETINTLLSNIKSQTYEFYDFIKQTYTNDYYINKSHIATYSNFTNFDEKNDDNDNNIIITFFTELNKKYKEIIKLIKVFNKIPNEIGFSTKF